MMGCLTWPDRPEKLSEILDDPDVDDQTRLRILGQLPRVNRWLGGWRALRTELAAVVDQVGMDSPVLDVGCGVGDLGERIQTWSEQRGRPVQVVGIDLSLGLLRAAGGRHVIPVRADGFRLPFPDGAFHLVTASLFLHHFTGSALTRLFGEMCRVARAAVVVNDLRRSRVAWLGWKLWSMLFTDDHIIRYDGAVSIRKGFLPDDLYRLAGPHAEFAWTVRRHAGFRICLTGVRRSVSIQPERPPVTVGVGTNR